MAQYTRNLIFQSNDLGRNSTLVLTFDNNNLPGMYDNTFPTAFKVATFGSTGPYVFNVTFKSDYAFAVGQVNRGVIVSASTYTRINEGEKTILTKEGDPPAYSFSKPESIDPPTGQMVAENDTDRKVDICFGFFERPERPPKEVLLFQGVDAASTVQLRFTPILSGYITSDYKEDEVLRSQIPTPVVFKENLARLPETSYWRLEFNPASGEYSITRQS